MANMSPRANGVLERFRTAERLEARSLERMSEALLERIKSGPASQLGVDLGPIALPRPSWLGALFGGVSGKLVVGVIGLIVASGVAAWLWRGDVSERAAAPSSPPLAAGRVRSTTLLGRQWAELMRRAFGYDLSACAQCGSRMKLLAIILDRATARKILIHLRLPSEPPAATPARASP